MNKIFNWTVGSFFRSIGRLLSYIVIGGVIGLILSKNFDIKKFRLSDLILIDRIKADTFGPSYYPSCNGCATINGYTGKVFTSAPTNGQVSLDFTSPVSYDNVNFKEIRFSMNGSFGGSGSNLQNSFGVAIKLGTTDSSTYNLTQFCNSSPLTTDEGDIVATVSCPVPANYTKVYGIIYFIGQGGSSSGFFGYNRNITYVYDSSNSIINNQNQNTQDIINNQNSATNQTIEAQQNATQETIQSQQVCTLYNKDKIYTDNKYLTSTGGTGTNNNYGLSDYISLNNTTITPVSSLNGVYACYYNANQQLVSCIDERNFVANEKLTFPTNAKFIRITFSKQYNAPVVNICKNGNQAMADSITDDNVSDSTSSASSFFDNFTTTDHGGLSGIITAPLSAIQSLTSATCTPLTLPLPYVNKNLELPCMRSLYEQFFGGFMTIYDVITLGIVSYWIMVRIFNLVKDFKNPEHDEIEVLDL